MPKKHKVSRINHNTARTDNLQYALSKRNLIYKWIMSGCTLAEVAEKLKVSRSWLFKAFSDSPELNQIKEDAFADRREKVENNLYKLALGNYTTHIRHNKTVKSVRSDLNDKGETVNTSSPAITEYTDEKIEHINDPNLKAIAMILRNQETKNSNSNELDDTITEEDSFEYLDVEKLC